MSTRKDNKMQIFFNPPEIEKPLAIALGNFDGVHLGHKEIISIAQKHNLPTAVITFEPHPVHIFKPSAKPMRITDMKTKLKLLAEQGVEECYILKFNKSFAAITAKDFIERYLQNKFIVTGKDFSFGAGRAGNAATLKDVFKENYISSDLIGGYSSTKIRESLRAGDVQTANKMLGHNYIITGYVQKGAQQATQLGYPTANIKLKSNLLRPKYGVYEVRTKYGKAIANFGVRPTLDGQTELLEVHIFDFDKNIYGEKLEIEFINFIRNEKHFNNIEELKAQIEKDIKTIC